MTLVIANMFGIAQGRSELLVLLEDVRRAAMNQDGCLRYTVAASISDPDHYVVVAEWRDDARLRAHYASAPFERFQASLHGLLARPSEVTIHPGGQTRRPLAPSVLDPRDAD